MKWSAHPTYHDGDGVTQTGFYIAATDGRLIANCTPSAGATDEEMQEHARLIAAAPELLEAGRDALDELEQWQGADSANPFGDTIAKLRAAIAKATGQ